MKHAVNKSMPEDGPLTLQELTRKQQSQPGPGSHIYLILHKQFITTFSTSEQETKFLCDYLKPSINRYQK